MRTELHAHQKVGINFLLSREDTSVSKISGSILSDQMGLGKTIQTIGLIEASDKKITLLFCPPSLINMWEKQILRFTPQICTLIFSKEIDIQYEIDHFCSEKLVILCSYGLSFRHSIFKKIKVDRIVCDEAHYFRNPKSKTFKAINSISSLSRLVITGTPIQNSIRDISTLVNFIICRDMKLGIDFIKLFIKERMLYRTMEDIGINIPDLKIENTIIEPTGDNKRVLTLTDNIDYNHPLEKIIRTKQSSIYPQMLNNSSLINKYKIMIDSLENQKCECILKSINTKKENCIIFTEFISEQEYYKKHLSDHFKIGIIRGDVPQDERTRICTDTSYNILIIQIQAGSVGLNLQHFSVAYFTNFQWNPTVTEQAIGRINRIGQEKEMKIYFYKIKNSIEEQIEYVGKRKKELILDILNIN